MISGDRIFRSILNALGDLLGLAEVGSASGDKMDDLTQILVGTNRSIFSKLSITQFV